MAEELSIGVDATLSVGGSDNQACYLISSNTGIKIDISPIYSFKNIDTFKGRLLMGEIIIPPNQVLTIEDPMIDDFLCEYEKFFDEIVSETQFILCKMFLLEGKTVEIVDGGKGWDRSFNFMSEKATSIEISSPEGLTLRLQEGVIYADINDLGSLLVRRNLEHFRLAPNQKLVIYNIPEEEIISLIKARGEETIDKLMSIFFERSPLGFGWSIHSEPPPFELNLRDVALRGTSDKTLYAFEIRSEKALFFSLIRASGEGFILNLLRDSPKSLLQSLEERDDKAFTLVLFKTLYYFCCQDFRYYKREQLPTYFKDTTCAEIISIVKNEDFSMAIRLLNTNEQASFQMKTILEGTPEEFSQLKIDELPFELQILMKKLLELTYREMQGSQFITECLGRVQTHLESKKNPPSNS